MLELDNEIPLNSESVLDNEIAPCRQPGPFFLFVSESDRVPQPKLGKAKATRAKKAAWSVKQGGLGLPSLVSTNLVLEPDTSLRLSFMVSLPDF